MASNPLENIPMQDRNTFDDIPPDYDDDPNSEGNDPEKGLRRRNKRHSSHEVYSHQGENSRSLARHSEFLGASSSQEDDLREQLPSRNMSNIDATKKRKLKRVGSTGPIIKSGFSTIRLRGGQISTDDLNDITDGLMTEENFKDWEENVKDLPVHLKDKRDIRQKVVSSKKENEKRAKTEGIGCCKQLRWSVALGWKRSKQNLAEAMYSLELWRSHLKKLEGNFGTGVASYFLFLKWLLFLNIPVFLLSFSFVVVPQLVDRIESGTYENSRDFSGTDILTGGGWFYDTELYYGSYKNGTIIAVGSLSYSMQYAYLLVTAAYYVVSLVIILVSLTKSFRQNFIDSSDAVRFYYVTKVLCGWDHNVTELQACELKHRSLYTELKEYLSTMDEQKSRTLKDKCGLFWWRTLLNIIIIVLIGGSAALFWYVYGFEVKDSDPFLTLMWKPFTFTAINFIFPYAFSIIVVWERYDSPRMETYLTMSRTILLNMATLGVLCFQWFQEVDCGQWSSNQTTTMSPNTLQAAAEDLVLPKCECWENYLGMEIYKLVILDFIFILLVTFLSEVVRKLCSKCCPFIKEPEFNIGRNTLYLIYSQMLVWLGTFYSPLLSAIAFIKVIIVFYIKRFSVMNTCRPSVKPWRAGRTNTVILALLFISILASCFVVLYSIISIRPSPNCGPYQGYANSYQVITNRFEAWREESSVFQEILIFLASPQFLACVLIGLCVCAYYMHVIAQGLKEMVDLLQRQISLEGDDKLFLLKLLQSTSPTNSSIHQGPITKYESSADYSEVPRTGGDRKFSKTLYQAAGQNSQGALSHPSSMARSPAATVSDQQPSSAQWPSIIQQPSSAQRPSITQRPQQPQNDDDGTRDNYNETYLDRSHDDSLDELRHGYSSANPSYLGTSPTNRPNLPYPGQQYDILHPGQQGL